MRKYLCCFQAVLIFALMGCIDSGSGPKENVDQKENVDPLMPQDQVGNFVLYVSNQSFALTPVDITIQLDGKAAVSSSFDVGKQHTWIKHVFKLTAGAHQLVAASVKGEAEMKKDFEIKSEKHWAVVAYWHDPKQSGEKHFSFQIQNKPIFFE
jgi:hypothetical protein